MSLFQKTVDGVMSAFTRAIADLTTVEREQREIESTKLEQSAILVTEANEAGNEARRAARIRERLAELVEADEVPAN
jgi:hypothetical protein